MIEVKKTYEELLAELSEVKIKLEEANETIEAIRTGQVDAIVVQTGKGSQLYTLRGADETYRIFIEQMKEGAVTLNREGIILYSNSRFASLLGKPLEQVIGKNFFDLLSPAQKEHFRILFQAGWIANSKGELLIRSTHGKSIPFVLSLTTLQLDEDTALSIIISDLSEQKAVEKQLKEKNDQLVVAQQEMKDLNEDLETTVQKRTRELFLSQEHFRFLADNIPQVIWHSNAKGDIEFFNRYWMDFTGLSLEESKGWGWLKAVHPSERKLKEASWKKSVESGTPFWFEHRLKRHDGTYRWHLTKAHAMRNAEDQIEMWIGTNADIHDQKHAMEKKDEFIGLASHELKTPLTSVKAYLQLLERNIDNPDHKIYVEKANKHICKLQDLISDLLDVSKIQAGKLELNKTKFDFDSFIKESLESFQHTAVKHQILFSGEVNTVVFADPHRIEQVLINFLSNAIKYSPNGEKIKVHTSAHNGHVKVSITDYGIGIPKVHVERIFTKFYRVQNISKAFEGLGIGLFISAEIVKRHKGEVGVESKEGEGSTFYFTLPAAEN